MKIWVKGYAPFGFKVRVNILKMKGKSGAIARSGEVSNTWTLFELQAGLKLSAVCLNPWALQRCDGQAVLAVP